MPEPAVRAERTGWRDEGLSVMRDYRRNIENGALIVRQLI